jgi:hypothetical protein
MFNMEYEKLIIVEYFVYIKLNFFMVNNELIKGLSKIYY